ncbi:MAG: hypothetical protein FWD06_00680 [Oscillospiraceae bacterium]|nr:hypothetical protein [Oscillospiraceae bacterium]
MNASEIIREMSAELELYRLYAYSTGLKSKEQVEEAVKRILEDTEEESPNE